MCDGVAAFGAILPFAMRRSIFRICPKAATRPGDGFRAKAWQSTDMAQVRVSLVFESGARMRSRGWYDRRAV